MNKLTKNDFSEIRTWMYRNARHVELALWQYEFEGGNKEAVLDAMAIYQNPDGGFGNKFEPDNWNPESSPYITAYAIMILSQIEFDDANHPVVAGMLRYYGSDAYCTENGWHFTLPNNDNYPHAPWWNYDPSDANIDPGLSCEIVAFILAIAEKNSPVYKKAFAIAGKLVERAPSIDAKEEGGAAGYSVFLEALQKLNLIDALNAHALPDIVAKLVADTIVLDSAKWSEYGYRPSWLVKSKDSAYYDMYKTNLEEERDYLLQTLPTGEPWHVPFSWYGNNDIFPQPSAITGNWWKGIKAIENLQFLKKFGWME